MLAIIGGSGWDQLPGFIALESLAPGTPYGEMSAPIRIGLLDGRRVAFLPRHGDKHQYAPHQVNYRANIWALKSVGVVSILAINAVGGIAEQMGPGVLVAPDQLIDYSWGRAHSFCDSEIQHIEFAEPFAGPLRDQLLSAAERLKIALLSGAVYACTQGPRLETAAEIRRLKRDGCDVVGMTAMPEAALAREAGLDYASLCVVVNWAAGLSTQAISLEDIYLVLRESQPQVQTLIQALTQGTVLAPIV